MNINFLKEIKSFLGDFFDPVMLGIKIILTIAAAILVAKLGCFLIKKLFRRKKSSKFKIDGRKLDTLATLLVSVFRYAVYIIAGITVLSDLGIVNTGSVLAAAGVGGIVIGLGAQSLIKDIISGFFIIMENQFVVGDLVTIENMNGTVEEMELRVTKLRNFNGDLYIIPNGEIKKVTNHARGSKAVTVDIPVTYGQDVNKVIEAASKVCAEAAKENKGFVEPPGVLGITDLGRETMTLRIVARTQPNEHWEAERRIRKLVREEFDRQGIYLGISPGTRGNVQII